MASLSVALGANLVTSDEWLVRRHRAVPVPLRVTHWALGVAASLWVLATGARRARLAGQLHRG